MRFSFFILISIVCSFLGLSISSFLTAAEPSQSEAAMNNLYRQFAREILFAADLDKPNSLIAAGSETPTQQSDDVQFGPGLRGQGLVNGKIRYSADKNVDPAAGTVLFWMRVARPEGQTDPKEPNFWPLYIEFNQGQMLAGKMDIFNSAPIYTYLQGHPAVGLVLVNTYQSTKTWKPDDWHLIVVCWQPGELKISLDGQPFVNSVKMPPLTGVPKAIEIRATNHSACSVAIDEVIVLNRPITEKEAADVARSK